MSTQEEWWCTLSKSQRDFICWHPKIDAWYHEAIKTENKGQPVRILDMAMTVDWTKEEGWPE